MHLVVILWCSGSTGWHHGEGIESNQARIISARRFGLYCSVHRRRDQIAGRGSYGKGLSSASRGEYLGGVRSPGKRGEQNDLEFESTLKLDGRDRLLILYKITNRGSKPYLVFNRLPGQLDSSDVTPDQNAVFIEPQSDGTVEISKRAYALPDGPTVNTPYIPGASELLPGASINEQLEVKLPLRRHRPYMSVVSAPRMPNPIRTVRFCVGVAQADQSTTKAFGSGKDRALYPQYSVVLTQRLLCGPVVTLE